jgi:hypothetical protein
MTVAEAITEIGSGKATAGYVKSLRGVSQVGCSTPGSQRLVTVTKVMDSTNLTHLGQPIKEMIDSSDLLRTADFRELYGRMVEHGYIFLRDVIPREKVLQKGQKLLEHLKAIKGEHTSGRAFPRR